MVGWNDLPTELKKKVVQMLFDESMESEDDYRSFEAFQTLKALNAVDRELHVLSAPLRWQFLDAAQCSLSLIHSFADKVGVSKGQFIRNIKLWQPETAARELLAVVEAYVKLLSTLTGLAYLEIRCRPSVALGVLPLLPPTLPRTLRCLKLRGWSEKNFITSDLAAVIIYAFPEVVELEFFDICQGSTEGAALAVKALRSLQKLQELSLGDGDGFTHASLALPRPSVELIPRRAQPPRHGRRAPPSLPSRPSRTPLHHTQTARDTHLRR
ncbi:hypothetical protein BCR35DRAFT_316147 [Leucosporidium creatinivorum]|uniref:F-box domain-containing protein n=1 Tax=Leucosporidium creatinivorum TaxID=106004 RepID=A0A1Y2D485_9BASI|nr:hypothetical protein BCR35DRAFT_316147 [Leucosporidium creatinivorum]